MPLKHSFYEPGIAVGSRTDVWVGAWSATRARHPGRLMHWNGRRWHMVDAPRLIVTETPLVTDGHHGVWMGPWAHWTGTRWVGNGATSALACSLVNFTRIRPGDALGGGGDLEDPDECHLRQRHLRPPQGTLTAASPVRLPGAAAFIARADDAGQGTG